MGSRPILFSGEMVRAILAGRKTQTRRVMKPQPVFDGAFWTYPKIDNFWVDPESMAFHLLETDDVNCPYGYAYGDGTGDRLWVRETWQAMNQDGFWWHEIKSEHLLHNWAWTNPVMPSFDETPPRWLPSIHMPRIASRITLEVTNVRVERVQDITRGDAIAEGINPDVRNPIVNFELLWNGINAKRGYGWDVNWWVWVVEFKMQREGSDE